MRLLYVLCVSALLGSIALAQETIGPEQRMSRIIGLGSYEGQDEKMFDRMGDAAAVALTKVLAGKTLDPSEIPGVLLVLRMSFASPRIIEIESDRNPRTTMFLLRYLDLSTSDPELKRESAETRRFIQEQYQKSRGQDLRKK